MSAAQEMIAVPCWSSWNTGIFDICLPALPRCRALRRLDVFEIDAAEGRLERLDDADDLFRILRVQLDVEDVDVGESLEQDALALHHRLRGERADVAQAEHGGAVAELTATRLPLPVNRYAQSGSRRSQTRHARRLAYTLSTGRAA